MDYQQDEPTTSSPKPRIKKYDKYVRQDTSTLHRPHQHVAATDVYDRLRHAPSVAASENSQKPSLIGVRQQTFRTSGTAQLAHTPPEKTRQQLPTAHQAALFAVRQASATEQDLLAEQFLGSLEKQTVKRQRLSRAQKLFYGVGSLVFLLALAVSLQSLLVNHQTKDKLGVLGAQTQKPDEYGVSEGSGDEPAEAEVPKAALSAYKVSPELPRYIRIPDLGVYARIKHTGITKDGAIDAPANINDVSWYNESAKPGSDTGTSLLLGHVSGWTAPGVFKKINQLKPGMRFEVEKGSGEKITYEVTRGESVPLNILNMGKVLTPEVPGEHDIKLMTCSGRFNRQADHFEERYIVYAKIVR